ncbi:histidine-containing phosphotransfer protein 1 isoform X1 [Beta vulgaris subsp. vulgaris]|uniref:histidine-containing phosphotransfer protein 1 isoform X1 n=1 Tax=Beta vulgaris subsp. vulgaris TaxID=3555 RepID=UPI00053F8F21|nr:histidine-containing phosphotransfer protein 1 isoform X1 [Beta vulgaris subsp. vulgaris]
MDVVQLLERQFIDYMKSLYMEHYLDDQFTQLQKLADESNPDFVYEVVTLFFQDSEKLIDNLTKALNLQVIDFNQVANHAHQFKGSSSSIGAHRVKNQCVKFRAYCEERNHDGCLTVLQDLQQEYIVLKKKFEILFQLEQDIVKNGGTIPTMD